MDCVGAVHRAITKQQRLPQTHIILLSREIAAVVVSVVFFVAGTASYERGSSFALIRDSQRSFAKYVCAPQYFTVPYIVHGDGMGWDGMVVCRSLFTALPCRDKRHDKRNIPLKIPTNHRRISGRGGETLPKTTTTTKRKLSQLCTIYSYGIMGFDTACSLHEPVPQLLTGTNP